MLNFKDKVVMVAGAGSVGPGWGNGRAAAVLFARRGASVFCLDFNTEALEETKRLIEEEKGTCLARTCNMTVAAEVEAAVQACLERFGRIDVLVNNVGGSAPGDPVAMSEETWDAQLDHNLKSAFLGCKYVLPVMEKQGAGAIVNMSSTAALRMSPDRVHVAYSAAKGAIVTFSKSVAMAYIKKGVRCNTVTPGLMHTPLVEHRLAKSLTGGDVAALVAKRNAQAPMGRMGDAWDVANAVVFLASDEAKYITGAELVVDGGVAIAGMS
jgi:NAD(P)-dependent dehydrogenase (short-subunit alcohol dehydrogenase family)